MAMTPAQHGFPVRAIVPGWYAMASVKWLQRIVVTNKPFTWVLSNEDYDTGKGEGTWRISSAYGECKSQAEIARQLKAKLSRQFNVRVTARLGQAMMESHESRDQHGRRGSWKEAKFDR